MARTTRGGSISTASKPKSVPLGGHNTTVSVRKISNGYVVRESSVDSKGNFKEKETFTKTKPDLRIK